jgi:MtN3 and saliva related transmembrane protein
MSGLYVLTFWIVDRYLPVSNRTLPRIGERPRIPARGVMDGVEYVGLVATSFGTLAFLPQVVKTWQTRSARDFSLATLCLLEGGSAIWVFYGLMRHAPAIWIGNGIVVVLAGFILGVKIRGVWGFGGGRDDALGQK